MTKKPNSVCRWTQNRLPLLADSKTLRELDKPEREHADRHLAECPHCRDHLQSLDGALHALQIVAETPDPDADESSLWPLLQQRIRQSQPMPVSSPTPSFEIRLASPFEESQRFVSQQRAQAAKNSRRWAIAAGVLIASATAAAFALFAQSNSSPSQTAPIHQPPTAVAADAQDQPTDSSALPKAISVEANPSPSPSSEQIHPRISPAANSDGATPVLAAPVDDTPPPQEPHTELGR